MQSADLNLTTNVTGHQRFLFIKLPQDANRASFAKAIAGLGGGMENMHYVDGPPSAEAFSRGRYQMLRAEPSLSSEQGISHPAVMDADALDTAGGRVVGAAARVRGRPEGTAGGCRRQRGDAFGSAAAPQLHQPRHDPVRLRPRPAAGAGSGRIP